MNWDGKRDLLALSESEVGQLTIMVL